jgi:hypothetical protein
VLLRRSGVGPADEAVRRKPTNQRLDQADLETIGIISLVIGRVVDPGIDGMPGWRSW